MKKVRIAQIGTSKFSHGSAIWRSLIKQTDIFEVVGYAFPENERKKFPKETARFDGYREMTVEEILNDPEIEAVVVETEEVNLTKYAVMVARAGKHLHMEKPGGTDLADFRKLVDLVREKGLVFSVGYMYRFNPKIQEAIQKIRNGDLGRIYAVEAHMDCKHDAEQRQWLENFPGGMMFFLGCHLIDLIYQIQGEPMKVVPLSCSTGIGGIHTEDYGMVVYQYPNGLSFAKTCDNECGGFLRRQLVICGEKGTIEIKPLEVDANGGKYTVLRESYNATRKNWSMPWEEARSDIFDRYDSMMQNFAEMVRGKKNPYSYDYELGLYELLLRSCGRTIK
ncbi:MAG: Gfo/Idh/MocA family oxidoreductase [Ruminococcaceae bacterium]|nr:Gfo/Idh/MocA family oxidoreductase [Oscillospiraceae bacterium]